jgi:hypothetical protein
MVLAETHSPAAKRLSERGNDRQANSMNDEKNTTHGGKQKTLRKKQQKKRK